MTQTAKIRIKGSNYPTVRFFMWVALASFAMMFIALWLSKLVLAAVGFILLLIAWGAGHYFHSKGLGSQKGLRCKKCGQPVDLRQALSTAPPNDRVARCHYCGEPFGEFSN
jgi:DNA-directed RNA polymerase subunit RPC12/RpoP